MTQRPILFSTPMVQAIMESRKTMTRRVVKIKDHQPSMELKFLADTYPRFQFQSGNRHWHIECPYGQPGDVLWVRESYSPKYFDDGKHGYKADWNETAAEYVSEPKWKPSIHMPKDAARIWLRITNVRVERLQDISDEDAKFEGIQEFTKDGVGFKYGLDGWHWSCQTGAPFMLRNRRLAFGTLWESINGKESWKENPWVWVVEFERIEKPENA